MSIVQGTIVSSGEAVDINLPTVRINELVEITTPLDGNDRMVVYDASENATRAERLIDLRNYFITGGAGAPLPPVITGNRVEIVVDLSNKVGDNRVVAAALDNKMFTLERVGYGSLLASQYNILPSGGFDIVDDDVRIGDIFFAEIYTVGTGTPGTTPAAGSIINGITIISDDTPLNANHRGKLLHLSNTTKNLTVTLEDVLTAPANLITVIETTIANGWGAKIQTQGGQLIYFNGSAVTSILLGANEFLWLLRGVDGYYVMKASESILLVGQPLMDYVVRTNTAVARGQMVSRTGEYARLWDWANSNSLVLVNETDWQATPANKGRFSRGDGTTTFRLPDHQNQAYRALNNINASDPERPINQAGILQGDKVIEHDHTFAIAENGTGNSSGTPYSKPAMTDNNGIELGTGVTKDLIDFTTGLGLGGTETRMKNVGLLPLIRI